MCNLYSMTTTQAAIRELSRAMRDGAGNMPPLPGIFPDYPAPIVRTAADGVRELAMGAIHPEAMPVILTEPEEMETWMSAPWPLAQRLQRLARWSAPGRRAERSRTVPDMPPTVVFGPK